MLVAFTLHNCTILCITRICDRQLKHRLRLSNTFVVDSLGRTADSASLVIDSDSVITVVGADNAIDWSFDRQLINDFGQPVLDQLEASFNGNQKFKILSITEDELVLYLMK